MNYKARNTANGTNNGGQPQNPSGARPSNGGGKPQNPSGARPSNGGGQPPQNPYGSRPSNGGGQPLQNPNGSRPSNGGGQPPQNPYGSRPSNGGGQPPQNPNGPRPGDRGQPPQNPNGPRPSNGGGQPPQNSYGSRPSNGGQPPHRVLLPRSNDGQNSRTYNNDSRSIQNTKSPRSVEMYTIPKFLDENLHEEQRNFTGTKSPWIQTRPQYGKSGKKVNLIANSYILTYLPTLQIFHYDIEITPAQSKNITKEILDELDPKFHNLVLAHDGRKNLFCKEKYFDEEVIFEVERKGKKISVKLQLVKLLKPTDLYKCLTGQIPFVENFYALINALDIILRYSATKKHKLLGKTIFTEEDCMDIGGGLVAWNGYYQSVRPAFGRLILNVNSKSAPFYPNWPLIDVLCAFANVRDPRYLEESFRKPFFVKKVLKFLKNLKVESTHLNYKRKYSINGISKKPAREIQFEICSSAKNLPAKKIDVEKYFLTQYQKKLVFSLLPCIEVGTKGNYLPIECCVVASGQAYRGLLDEQQTSKMIEITRKEPSELFRNIQHFGKKLLLHDNNNLLEEFGLKVGNEFIELPARIIPPPNIKLLKNTFQPKNGAFNFSQDGFIESKSLSNWGVIYTCDNPEMEGLCNRFVEQLNFFAQKQGIKILHKPTIYPVANIEQVPNEIKTIHQKSNGICYLFIISSFKITAAVYNQIKTISETQTGILTQCLIKKNIVKGAPDFYSNLLLKLNAKLGGTNFKLAENSFLNVPTILFGADVTHPPPGAAKDTSSVAAVVYSLDKEGFQYGGVCTYQTGRVEMIESLENMIIKGLREYQKKLNITPQRLIFFRDGVSEGQFEQVLKRELPHIRTACEKLSIKPKITIIITQKRHHQRFDSLDPDAKDRSKNLLPGTVIETGVTHPTDYDFILYTHSGIQGVSRPCYYRVILDENQIPVDTLQAFLFHSCFLYARCSRAVSLFPAVYYADILCDRGRRYLTEGEEGGKIKGLIEGMYWV